MQLSAAGAIRDVRSKDETSSFSDSKRDPTLGQFGDLVFTEVERASADSDEGGAAIRSRRSPRLIALVMLLVCVFVGVSLGIWQRDHRSLPSTNRESQPAVSISAGGKVGKEEPNAERGLAQPLTSQSADNVLPQSTEEVIRPARQASAAADPEARRAFYLPFGRFQSEQNADDYHLVLVNKGIPSTVVLSKDRGANLFVVVSPTSSIEDIRALRDVVRTKGVDAVIKGDDSLSKK